MSTELLNPGHCSPEPVAQDFARTWNSIVMQEKHDMADWIAKLREMNVVAAMADDGRVDRLRSELRLTNPDFLRAFLEREYQKYKNGQA